MALINKYIEETYEESMSISDSELIKFKQSDGYKHLNKAHAYITTQFEQSNIGSWSLDAAEEEKNRWEEEKKAEKEAEIETIKAASEAAQKAAEEDFRRKLKRLSTPKTIKNSQRKNGENSNKNKSARRNNLSIEERRNRDYKAFWEAEMRRKGTPVEERRRGSPEELKKLEVLRFANSRRYTEERARAIANLESRLGSSYDIKGGSHILQGNNNLSIEDRRKRDAEAIWAAEMKRRAAKAAEEEGAKAAEAEAAKAAEARAARMKRQYGENKSVRRMEGRNNIGDSLNTLRSILVDSVIGEERVEFVPRDPSATEMMISSYQSGYYDKPTDLNLVKDTWDVWLMFPRVGEGHRAITSEEWHTVQQGLEFVLITIDRETGALIWMETDTKHKSEPENDENPADVINAQRRKKTCVIS